MIYNDTVTVFNRRQESRTVTRWIPTVFHGVELQRSQGANITATGIANADAVKLFVRNTKGYISPKAYAALADVSGVFTLTSGTDFLWLGEWTDGLVLDSAYVGGFFEHMKARDNVWKITTVDVCKLIPHFEIGGA